VRPPLDRVRGPIIVVTLLAWAPLLVLSTLGSRLASSLEIPFLRDIEVHTRFLLALPLLIGAEVTVYQRIRNMVLQFVDQQIITPEVLPRFEACIESALRLRNSAIIELGLLALIFGAENFWWKIALAIPVNTWYATVSADGNVLAPAGYWYVFVSLPIIQFIALRWYFRLLIWGRLLWQVSRLNLNLVPIHPDSCCGLGFLGQVPFALAPFLLAHSVLLSGYLAERILYRGAKLTEQKIEIVVVALFLYLIALGPLCVFVPRLLHQRLNSVYRYGSLASEYVIGFEKKWIEGQRTSDEPLLGSSDIQSLADLANSFTIVQHIRPFPFGREALIAVAVIVALPILPLTLTLFSFQELVSRLVKVLF
jgi:hypothetical protein